MIRLDLQEYCESCFDFEPDIIKPERVLIQSFVNPYGQAIQSDTIVRCRYARRCEAIKRYLDQKHANETKN